MGKKRTQKRAGTVAGTTPVSDRKRDLFDKLLATHPAIQRKGRNLLYTSVNGHMFTMFSTAATLGMRLAAADREAFQRRFDSPPFTTYGVVMKEYVAVPDSLLARTGTLAPWLAKSYEYARSLKPKAGKR